MKPLLPTPGKGFSLAELMVSVGLISTAILLAIGVFTALLRSTQKSADRSSGAVVAGSVLNDEIYSIFSGTHPTMTKNAFFTNNSPPGGPLLGTVNLNGTLFSYQIYHTTLQDVSGGGGTIGDVMAANRLKRADITVWWWTPQAENQRSGYGYLRTGLSKLINEKQEF